MKNFTNINFKKSTSGYTYTYSHVISCNLRQLHAIFDLFSKDFSIKIIIKLLAINNAIMDHYSNLK